MPQKKKGSKVLTVISACVCVVLALILVCNLTIIVKGTINPEMPPSVLGTTPLVVLSGSMSGDAVDHIEVGDLIFATKADPEQLQEGDVISFMESETTVVTHRIIEVGKSEDGKIQWKTKGDANNAEDKKPVTEDQLIGKYKTRIPKAGDFAMFMQTPIGMMIFVGVPVFGYIIYDIIRRRRQAQKEDTTRAEMEAEIERLKALAGEKPEE